MSMEGFYELYRLWAGNAEPTEIAGSRLFASIYQERWRDLIRFRETSQHAKCPGYNMNVSQRSDFADIYIYI